MENLYTAFDEIVSLYSKYFVPYVSTAQSMIQSTQSFGQVSNGITAMTTFAKGLHRHPCRAQDGADGLDPEFIAMGVDEVDYFLCWRSSSAPKKLAARFRISPA